MGESPMRAATLTIAEASERTLKPIRDRITECEDGLTRLNESVAVSRSREAELEPEREKLILPARLSKNAEAQKNLHAIDLELARLRHDISDDEEAIAGLARELDSARKSLTVAIWEQKRDGIRDLLKSHLSANKLAFLQRAAESLVEALKSAEEEDKRVYLELLKFNPGLRREGQDIRNSCNIRGKIIAEVLRGVLPIETDPRHNFFRDKQVAEEDQRFYGAAIEALDRLELVF